MTSLTVKFATLLPVAGLLIAAAALPADAARDRATGNAVVRDHAPKSAPVVRDHRANAPIIHDHRSSTSVVQTGPNSFKQVGSPWSPYKPSR